MDCNDLCPWMYVAVLLGVICLLASKWRSLLHKNLKLSFNDVGKYQLCYYLPVQPIKHKCVSCFVSSKQKCHSTYSSGFYAGYYNEWRDGDVSGAAAASPL